MHWLIYLVIAFVLGSIAFIIIAIFLARRLGQPRQQLGPINQAIGGTPPTAPQPAILITPPVNTPPVVPAPPVTKRWNWSWMRTGTSYVVAPFQNTSLLTALFAVGVAALAFFLLSRPSRIDPTYTPPPVISFTWRGSYLDSLDQWSLWLGVAALIMIAFAFWYANRVKLVTFLYVTALVLIVYTLYKNGTLDIGQRRNLLYLLAIAAAVLVITYATTFSERLTFGILVAALFIMLGFSHVYSWDQFRNLFGWPTFHGRQVAQITPLQLACPGIKHTLVFGSAPVPINPQARCAPDVWHDGHCLWLKKAAWTHDKVIYGPHCQGRFPNDVEWAWSADTPFIGAVALEPPRYN